VTAADWPGFDPELAHWLDQAEYAPAGSSAEVMREFSRRNTAAALARTDRSLLAPPWVEEVLDGPGGPIPVRILTSAGAGRKPLVVYFHGGGWVLGDFDTHMAHASRLCVELGGVVVLAGFRSAPEHRFPAAFDDCFETAVWASMHAARLGADPSTLIVAGDSAGGQLAASVAIGFRDAGRPLAAQLLVYPVTDVTGRYVDDAINARYRSRAVQAAGPGLTLASMAYFVGEYLGNSEPSPSDSRLSPIQADLRGVAPTVLHTARFDVLRDEGRRYAERLDAAGVRVIARDFSTLNHSYFGLGGLSKAADTAAAQAATDLRELLGLTSR
jgi:acetyl esterase